MKLKITIEGDQGVGKSTIAQLIKDSIRQYDQYSKYPRHYSIHIQDGELIGHQKQNLKMQGIDVVIICKTNNPNR